MSEEKSYKKPKEMVAVQVIGSREKASLVKYLDGETLCQVYVPTNKVTVGKDKVEVEKSVLKRGMPYGLPWENVELPEITGEQLADELHKYGIWTAEEYRSNPNGVRAAIQQLYGKPLAILTRFIVEETKKK